LLGDGGWEERKERGAGIGCKWEGRHLPCRVDDLSG